MTRIADWFADGSAFRYGVGVALAITLVLGTLVGGIVGLIVVVERKTRYDKAHLMDVSWQWGMFSGCMVEVNGEWFPIEQVRDLPERDK